MPRAVRPQPHHLAEIDLDRREHSALPLKKFVVRALMLLVEGTHEMKARRLSFGELCERLRALEQKHGFSSVEFLTRFESGELGHEDEFMTWAGLYHLYLTSLPVRQFMRTEPQPA